MHFRALLPAARQRVSKGSGLGLAIAQNIAQIHGAKISIHHLSRDGGGNTFEVTFPPVSRSD